MESGRSSSPEIGTPPVSCFDPWDILGDGGERVVSVLYVGFSRLDSELGILVSLYVGQLVEWNMVLVLGCP